MAARLALAIALSLLLGCGCSSTSSSSGPEEAGGTGPGGDGSSDGSSGSSGGSSGGGPSDAGADASAGATKAGNIVVNQTTTKAGGSTFYSAYAYASFYAFDGAAPVAGPCATTMIGACTIFQCNLGPSTSDAGVDAGPYTAPNAGSIAVTGGLIAPGGLVLTPGGVNGAYSTPMTQTQIFAAGDSISVEASGGDVPAFTGKVVTAPSDLSVTAPLFDQSSKTSLARSMDLAVSWTPGAKGSVQVALTSTQQSVHSAQVICTFPASGGGATVPAAVLSKLDKANGMTIYGSITVTPFDEVPFKAGDWDVKLRANATGKAGIFIATD